jgi:enamine deaminase RidA (YjgF/YER057c/UK114 family)
MELPLALVTQVAAVRMKIHQHISRLLVQVAQDLLAEEVPSTAVAAVAVLAAPVLHVEMDLYQLQEHLQAVLA